MKLEEASCLHICIIDVKNAGSRNFDSTWSGIEMAFS